MWRDNVKTRILKGTVYEKVTPEGKRFDSQAYFIKQAQKQLSDLNREKKNHKRLSNVFETLTRHVSNLHLDNTGKDSKHD